MLAGGLFVSISGYLSVLVQRGHWAKSLAELMASQRLWSGESVLILSVQNSSQGTATVIKEEFFLWALCSYNLSEKAGSLALKIKEENYQGLVLKS